jgi:NADH:ubiquinone reductase (non-electrogenic)
MAVPTIAMTMRSIGFNIARMNAPSSTIMRRTLAASSRSFVTRARPSIKKQDSLQKSFRRAYADAQPAVGPAKKARRFRYFRFLWRLTYLSVIGGTAYLAYGVWDLRHPDDQFEPDPNKKNLVILGEIINLMLCVSALLIYAH